MRVIVLVTHLNDIWKLSSVTPENSKERTHEDNR
jgi:hypothetical protein